MAIVPMIDCEMELNMYWFLKATNNCVLLFSRNKRNEVNRQIQGLIQLRFLLIVRNLAFDNFNALTYSVNKIRKVIYCFSTVKGNGTIDSTTTLAKSSENKVGNKDSSWLVNPVLSLSLNTNFTQIDLSHVVPGSGKQLIKSFSTTGLQNFTINLSKLNHSLNPSFRLKSSNCILNF